MPKQGYAGVYWNADDVVTLCPSMTMQQAADWLAINERNIEERITDLGWGVIGELLLYSGWRVVTCDNYDAVGVMNTEVVLQGTSLSLQKGQRVLLVEAINQPGGGWFASPANGKWSDGVERGEEDSILLNEEDFTFLYYL